jgi:predicted 3-demethylubiquinone-9 3-methyltransferase (glyoxalase superfamily)
MFSARDEFCEVLKQFVRKGGVSWKITPRVVTEPLTAGGDEAKRALVR